MNMFLEKYRPLYAPLVEGGGGESGAPAPSADATSGSAQPTPSPSPDASATGASGAETPSTSSDDFSGLGDDLDTLDEIELPTDEAPGAPSATGAPSAPAAQSAEKGTVPPPPAAAADAAKTSPPAAEGPKETPAPSPSEPPALLEQLAAEEQTLISALAAERFALSKEEAEALELDVIGNIPKIAAKVYYNAVTTALRHIETQVPRIVQAVLSVSREAEEATKGFYGQFKALDQTKHHGDVVAFSNAFRTANPQISREDLWAMVGSAVMAKHGLSALPPQQNGSAAPPRPQSQSGFVPATPGAVVRVTPDEESPFAGLGQEFDED